LVGVIGIAINALAFIKNHDPVFVGLSLIGVGFAGLYLYWGLSLTKLLRGSPHLLVRGLIAGACYLVAVALLELLGGSVAGVIRSSIGLLITWYLITNVRRLSAMLA